MSVVVIIMLLVIFVIFVVSLGVFMLKFIMMGRLDCWWYCLMVLVIIFFDVDGLFVGLIIGM